MCRGVRANSRAAVVSREGTFCVVGPPRVFMLGEWRLDSAGLREGEQLRAVCGGHGEGVWDRLLRFLCSSVAYRCADELAIAGGSYMG